jgi:hypothetical protein
MGMAFAVVGLTAAGFAAAAFAGTAFAGALAGEALAADALVGIGLEPAGFTDGFAAVGAVVFFAGTRVGVLMATLRILLAPAPPASSTVW